MELTQQRVYDVRPGEVVANEQDDEGLASLWLADRRPDEVRYVILSRSLPSGSTYIERDDQKWNCYDGVLAVALDADRLTIDLDHVAAESLGGIASIKIDCRGLNEETWERMARTLRAIFARTSVPLIIA